MIVAHFTGEAPGAYPNGTRIVKVLDEPGDVHRVGDRAKVLGSLGPATEQMAAKDPHFPRAIIGHYFYFVEWDDMPGLGMGVGGHKIAQVAS